jgi:hypothetical protein
MTSRRIPSYSRYCADHDGQASELELGKAYLRLFDHDHELRDHIEARLLSGLLTPHAGEPAEIVVLLHGIRTFGGWQHKLVHEMELIAPEVEVQPIRYKFVDIFTFLGPEKYRRSAIDRVIREIRDVSRRNPGVPISIVAHSFGTYVTSEVLSIAPDIHLHRVLLCGAIIPEDYRWADVRLRIAGSVVNDVGTRDIWPLLAKHVTVGYGPSGRFGFGSSAVRDRYFDLGHSDFFSDDHMKAYWIPFLALGQVIPSPWTYIRPSAGVAESLLAWVPVKKLVLGISIAAAACVYFFR